LPGGVADPSEFVGLVPDERLLEDQATLPEGERFTTLQPESRTRAPLVAAGSTMTALALIGGCALAVLGVVLAIANGISGLAIAAIVVGVVLVATHWGWIHVAEVAANALSERAGHDWRSRRAFGFESEVVESEVHASDEPGAVIAERAETMRHQAALDTNEQEELWRVASDAYTAELGTHADAEERRRAEIAASKALSERLNEKLKEPPLIE
jgi:hypothetical protein